MQVSVFFFLCSKIVTKKSELTFTAKRFEPVFLFYFLANFMLYTEG